ncbi:hypothetical protein C8Q73DRAFT_470578 [Cubamyces lactineus]|nr:hypothetical protein C8Q73DRAFT_470578 [Cubamyces lactineus]
MTAIRRLALCPNLSSGRLDIALTLGEHPWRALFSVTSMHRVHLQLEVLRRVTASLDDGRPQHHSRRSVGSIVTTLRPGPCGGSSLSTRTKAPILNPGTMVSALTLESHTQPALPYEGPRAGRDSHGCDALWTNNWLRTLQYRNLIQPRGRRVLDTLPAEILQRIFALSCTDGGHTGIALSLIFKSICAVSRIARYRSIA